MGSFICQISGKDWLISRKIGVYGNREGSERSGKPVYFNDTKKGDSTIQSIIEDLIGMRRGDTVFFHVLKKNQEESSVHGVYRVREEPFYNDKSRMGGSGRPFIYPYRFSFEPHPDFVELCQSDCSITVGEFYRAVERRDIRSVMTLEREERGAAHAVKRILSEDSKEIVRLLYKSFYSLSTQEQVEFKPLNMHMAPLRNYISRVGEIEFAIKAVIAYGLGQRDPRLTKYIPACSGSGYDFLIESFVGQTLRQPVDVLCIGSNSSRMVTIIEAKTYEAEMQHLAQSMRYQEVFKLRNADKGALTYDYSICLVAMKFHSELAKYALIRNEVVPWEQVVLLKYIPTNGGRDARFELNERLVSYVSPIYTFPLITERDPYALITSDPNMLSSVFKNREQAGVVTHLVRTIGSDMIVLEKSARLRDERLSLARVLIFQMGGDCGLEEIARFLSALRKEVNELNGDFMKVEPVIVATKYDKDAAFFIEKYNEYETLAQRQRISAYSLREKT